MGRLRRIVPRVRRVLWLVLANAAIFLGLLVVTNLVSGILLAVLENATVKAEVHNVLGIGAPSITDRGELPPYAGHEKRARAIWEELVRARREEYAPFVEWRLRPFAGTWVTIGENGDRVYHRPVEPPAEAPVIRLFGGSTLWGWGVEDSETIPAIYTRLHPRYRVYNHGALAFTSRQNLERLMNLLTQGEHADVAVIYQGFNDARRQAQSCRAGL